MTREEAEEYIRDCLDRDEATKVIEALEQQPSEECISILNRIMEYTYGMMTAEKYGLQHLIKSMMDEMSGGEEDGNSN